MSLENNKEVRPREKGTSENIWLMTFRDALEEHNIELLEILLRNIQTKVQGESTSTPVAVGKREVEELLETGETMVLVGSGTRGHRVYIDLKKRKIFMPFDELHSGAYARNFRYFFDLPDDDTTLTVNF